MTHPIRFTGIRNGRPEFDLGDRPPPVWLILALDRGLLVVRDDRLYAVGEPVEVGDDVLVTVSSG